MSVVSAEQKNEKFSKSLVFEKNNVDLFHCFSGGGLEIRITAAGRTNCGICFIGFLVVDLKVELIQLSNQIRDRSCRGAMNNKEIGLRVDVVY